MLCDLTNNDLAASMYEMHTTMYVHVPQKVISDKRQVIHCQMSPVDQNYKKRGKREREREQEMR